MQCKTENGRWNLLECGYPEASSLRKPYSQMSGIQEKGERGGQALVKVQSWDGLAQWNN